MKKLILVLGLVMLTGCAQIAPMMAGVNWWKVGAYACVRLSTKLNKKADKKQAELDAEKATKEQETSTKQDEDTLSR